MTRKEYETICRVLKASRRTVFTETADSIAEAMAEAFGLEGTQRDIFLTQAGLPPR